MKAWTMAALAALAVPAAAAPPAADMPKLDFLFEELVTLAPSTQVGTTPFGERNFIPILGGSFEGPAMRGKVLPGGWDWQLATASGCRRLKADYMIQADDGTIINVRNEGTACVAPGGAPSRILTTPVFEAPLGKYAWLNGGAYLGTIETASVDGKPAVRIRFYKAS